MGSPFAASDGRDYAKLAPYLLRFLALAENISEVLRKGVSERAPLTCIAAAIPS
jgi:hypothetical protein